MKKTVLLLLLFSLGFVVQAVGQCNTIVYGNVGVCNVNISISHTSHGTSSDALGRYALTLHDCTKPIHLYYSCIGYQDTVVSLSSQQLQHDSVNISFRMRKQKYNLQEVTVTAKQTLYGNRYYFMDFEVFDSTICILAACPNKNQRCLIMADETLRGHDTIPLPAHIKPERVIRDCMGSCQLIANDSVYEIDLQTQAHKIMAVEKTHYFRTMSDCLFATENHVYFKEKAAQGYFASFYRVDRETKNPQQLFMNDVTDNIRKYWDEMTFFMKYWSPTSHGAPPEVWSQHIKNQWFRPSDAELRLANDNLYYFDQGLGYIQHYDLNINKIDSCAIQYPFMEGWKHTLYQDVAQNRFYTFIKSQMYEINPTSGSIIAKAKLTPSLYPKIIVHDGQLFLLKKTHDSSGEGKTLIERRKL